MDESWIQNYDNPDDTVDHLLQYLVALVNRQDIEIGITLHVGGLTVSGKLTSGRKYFEGLAEEMLSATASDLVQDAFQALFTQMGNPYTQLQTGKDKISAALEQDFPKLGYIHLRNAKIFAQGSPSLNQGVWWRGRLSAVDGFYLGSHS